MSVKTALSAQAQASKFTKKMRTVAVLVVAVAFLMDLLDSTIVNIAIPAIQANLEASYATIQWLVAGYSLAFAVFLIMGGRMGDVFGYKKMFMIGVGGFTLASLLSGVAWDPTVLLIARLLQGAMAALMVPQVMSMVQLLFKPEERTGVMGMFGALGGTAASLGPVIGGVLLHFNIAGLDWRPIFLINVPLGILGLVLGIKYLPGGKSEHALKLDIKGTMLLVAAMGLLIFPLIEGRDLDWPWWIFAMLVASVPAFLLFARSQQRKERLNHSPLVVPALFRKRTFSAGLVVNLIFNAAMIGFSLTMILLLQTGLGFSPIHAALTTLPSAVGVALTMGIFGKMMPKLGRRAIVIGSVVMAAGLALIAWAPYHFGATVNTWEVLPGLLLTGIGMGFMVSTLVAVVLNDVNTKDAGSASGTLEAVQQVGGAIGVALIGMIFFSMISNAAPKSYDTAIPALKSSLAAQHIDAPSQDQIAQAVKACFVDQSREKDSSVIPESCTKYGQAPTKELEAAITKSTHDALFASFKKAFTGAVIFQACLFTVVIGLSFLLPKHIRPEAFENA